MATTELYFFSATSCLQAANHWAAADALTSHISDRKTTTNFTVAPIVISSIYGDVKNAPGTPLEDRISQSAEE